MSSINNIIISESTQPSIGRFWVGVANIWIRDLPDTLGKIEPRMSAHVSIFDPNSREAVHQKVFAGSVISLGTDRYQVTDVNEGTDTASGAITLQKIN